MSDLPCWLTGLNKFISQKLIDNGYFYIGELDDFDECEEEDSFYTEEINGDNISAIINIENQCVDVLIEDSIFSLWIKNVDEFNVKRKEISPLIKQWCYEWEHSSPYHCQLSLFEQNATALSC